MTSLKQQYLTKIIPALQEQFGYTNILAVPRPVKLVVSIGTGPGLKDPKFNEIAESSLKRITGQKPVKTLAKKSISNFKIREGQVVGMMVTLRGQRMYDFLEKLINVTLPRIRDFQGLATTIIDHHGNLNIGLKEHLAFPEIKVEEIEKLHGVQVTVVTTAGTAEAGLALFRLLGFPFRKA